MFSQPGQVVAWDEKIDTRFVANRMHRSFQSDLSATSDEEELVVPSAKDENTLTLVIEAVYPVDGGALVVPPQQEEVLGVFNLVGQEQADGLQRLLPSVHIVSQKQVVTFRGVSAVLKQPEQVVVLTVDITYGREREKNREALLHDEHRSQNLLHRGQKPQKF